MILMIIIFKVLILVLFCEMVLRFYILRHSPVAIRLAHTLFLLSPKRYEENIFIHKRIVRGGFTSEKELFEHYSTISGKPYTEIEKKFGREKNLIGFLSRRYYSGGHAVLEQMQKMHLGLVPKPNQKLQTLETDANGRRKTGHDLDKDNVVYWEKICLVLGNSVAFGAGATSDQNTIPGRIGHHLNKDNTADKKFIVINAAIGGCNSFEELIALMQFELKPNYVVALSGYNDPDQTFFSESKVSAWPRFCDIQANTSIIKRVARNLFNEFVIYKCARRFASAFMEYDSKKR